MTIDISKSLIYLSCWLLYYIFKYCGEKVTIVRHGYSVKLFFTSLHILLGSRKRILLFIIYLFMNHPNRFILLLSLPLFQSPPYLRLYPSLQFVLSMLSLLLVILHGYYFSFVAFLSTFCLRQNYIFSISFLFLQFVQNYSDVWCT